MNKEQRIKIAFSQLMVECKLDEVENLFTKGYIAHAGKKEYQGLDFIKKYIKQLHSAISGIKIVEIVFLNKSSDTITWQRTLSGINNKKMKGIPASGKRIVWTEMVVSRFEDVKISEEWIVSELMGELLLKVPIKKS